MPLDIQLLLADVLQVDRGDDGDAAVEQVFDILPALRIAAARRIVVGQLVDQADGRVAAEEGGKVEDFVSLSAVPLLYGRNDLEAGEHALDIRRVGALHQPHHHVLPALFAAPAFIEHAVRFADAGSVAEEDLEAAAPFAPFGGLNAAQQFLGAGSLVGAGGHFF